MAKKHKSKRYTKSQLIWGLVFFVVSIAVLILVVLKVTRGKLYLNRSKASESGLITVQGYKRANPNSCAGFENSAVKIDGHSPQTSNPYFITQVSPGKHTYTVDVPAGCQVGYTMCLNRIDCHNQPPVSGNSVEVTATQGYVDLYWHFSPVGSNQTFTVQGMKVNASIGCQNFTNATIKLDNQKTLSTNPYFFTEVSPGNHTLSITVPPDCQVGYTMCTNSTNCHNQSPTMSNTVQVNGNGGYVDLWWHFSPKVMERKPEGYVDVINNDVIAGWARDLSNLNKPIDIHIYVDDILVNNLSSNVYRSDVGNHAFNWNHGSFGPGKHTVKVYAIGIDMNGNLNNDNVLLKEAILEWPTEYTITSPNSKVSVTFNARFGGSITKIFDKSHGNQNMIADKSGGDLLQSAFWLEPKQSQPSEACPRDRADMYQINPTQGGFYKDVIDNTGRGNPIGIQGTDPRYPDTSEFIELSDNQIHLKTKFIRHDFCKSNSAKIEDKNLWDTPFYLEWAIVWWFFGLSLLLIVINVMEFASSKKLRKLF